MTRAKALLHGGIVLCLTLLAGCAVNPVTGEQELTLIGERQELAIGEKNYGPYRQAQGGDYTADPALVAYVQEVGRRIARVSDRPLPYAFRVVNDGTPNAWALPGGKIAVNRGLLLELKDEAELAAVLAHEVVHAAARHTARSMQRGIFLQGALMAAGVALRDTEYGGLGMLGAALGANLVRSRYSREAELEADAYGMRYMVRAGYDPAAAVSLQETFVRLKEGKRDDWLSGLFASHPPSRERVQANRRLLAALGNPGGDRGRDRFLRATERLRRVAPAYALFEEARKAVSERRFEVALERLERAIRIEPREARFHALRGEALRRLGRPREALRALDRAVALAPDYFLPRLQRGLALRELGRLDAARRELRASLELLPTAEARFGLGAIAERLGDRRAALEHYRAAAAARGEVARLAGRRLALLDLPRNPGRYLKAALRVRRDGAVLVELRNTAAVTVRDVTLAVGQPRPGGFVAMRRWRVRGPLLPGVRKRVDSGLRLRDAAAVRGLAVRVEQARPVAP